MIPSWKWELEHPGEVPPNNLKASWAASRKRLFNIIEDLVQWENTTNEEVLERPAPRSASRGARPAS